MGRVHGKHIEQTCANAPLSTSAKAVAKLATPAGSFTAWSTASNLMARCHPTKPLEVLPLEQLLQNPTKCKERLDEILEKVKGVWGDSESLRQKVHDQVDAVFNANGYECKNGTDCCAECKS